MPRHRLLSLLSHVRQLSVWIVVLFLDDFGRRPLQMLRHDWLWLFLSARGHCEGRFTASMMIKGWILLLLLLLWLCKQEMLELHGASSCVIVVADAICHH